MGLRQAAESTQQERKTAVSTRQGREKERGVWLRRQLLHPVKSMPTCQHTAGGGGWTKTAVSTRL